MMHANGAEPPPIPREPVNMRVQIGTISFPGGRYVMLRFATAQGESEFYLRPIEADALGKAMIEAGSGLVLPDEINFPPPDLRG
jgi:hypothetical protein